MTDETFLLRQISPAPEHLQYGRPTSLAFQPSKKDQGKLSVENGDLIGPEASWRRFVAKGFGSAGVMAIRNRDCASLELPVEEDGDPDPEHCSVVFSGLSRSKIKDFAAKLRNAAAAYGWQFQPQR